MAVVVPTDISSPVLALDVAAIDMSVVALSSDSRPDNRHAYLRPFSNGPPARLTA